MAVFGVVRTLKSGQRELLITTISHTRKAAIRKYGKGRYKKHNKQKKVTIKKIGMYYI